MTQDHREHRPPPPALVPPASAGLPDAAKPGGKAGLADFVPDATFAEGAPVDDRRALRRSGAAFRPPIAGALSVIFAVVAFYRTTLLLAPLAMIAGLVALCRRQYAWAAIGIIAALVALLTDITFWGWLGAAWMVRWLVWS